MLCQRAECKIRIKPCFTLPQSVQTHFPSSNSDHTNFITCFVGFYTQVLCRIWQLLISTSRVSVENGFCWFLHSCHSPCRDEHDDLPTEKNSWRVEHVVLHCEKNSWQWTCPFACRKKQLGWHAPLACWKTIGVTCPFASRKNSCCLTFTFSYWQQLGGHVILHCGKNSCDMTMSFASRKTVGLSILIRKAKKTVGTGMPVWKAKKTIGGGHTHLHCEKNSWCWACPFGHRKKQLVVEILFCETRKQGGCGHPLDARKTLRTEGPVSMARKQVGVDNAYLHCESNRLAMGMPICIANKLVSGWRAHLPDEKGCFGRNTWCAAGVGGVGRVDWEGQGWKGWGRPPCSHWWDGHADFAKETTVGW